MTSEATRVLLVEDDPQVAAGVVRGLRGAGFAVELTTSGAQALAALRVSRPDIVVLDLLLPETNGFEVLEALDGRGGPPVIVLTALAELRDRLRCFSLGAVDYVTKPFFVEELVARIRSRLRQRDEAPRRVVRWADASVDLDARVVTVAGQAVPLTRQELDVLAYMLERPGRAVSRRQLAGFAGLGDRGADAERDARTIDTHIARVRKKLGPAAAASVVTVWGIGYRFEPPEPRA